MLEAVTAGPLERGREVALAVRPEWARLSRMPVAAANQLVGEVVDEAYVGDMMHWRVRLGVTPEINAMSTLLLGIVAVALLVGSLVSRGRVGEAR
jgi:hypothetical protein